MGIQSYKDLKVWQKAIEIVREVYKVIKQLPKSEIYILSSQILRAAISISANIAEGFGRNSQKEFYQFLSIAYASLLELESHIIIVEAEYKHIQLSNLFGLILEEQKMLRVFMTKLKR